MPAWINDNILSFIIFTPLLGAALTLLAPNGKEGLIRGISLITTLVTFVLSLHLAWHFQGYGGYQFTFEIPWIEALGIHYKLGVDGFSLWLVLLSTLLMPIVTLFSTGSIKEKQKTYYFMLLVLETGMLGALCALDGFLFYIFWEAMLIPLYFLIGIFGHGRKIYTAMKFFLFTLVGSVLMFLGMLYLQNKAGGSFLLSDWLALNLSRNEQLILFSAFALSFAIKVPIVPLHTWLPDAHTEAPTAGSVILAGVLLKMGTYGLIRFAMPLFPQGLEWARPLLIVLAIVGILYGALVAMVQKDMKKLIAYSSISHLGFVILGLMALTPQAVTGSVYQMINHGVSSGALFLLVGMLYDRTHTREIKDYGGLAKVMPLYTVVFLIVTFSSIALPGTNGFVGEFLILTGSFQTLPTATIFATAGVIFSAVYMLWMVQRVFFGPTNLSLLPQGEGGRRPDEGLPKMTQREVLCMIPLLILIVWMGIKPNFFLNKIEFATQDLLERVAEQRVAQKELK